MILSCTGLGQASQLPRARAIDCIIAYASLRLPTAAPTVSATAPCPADPTSRETTPRTNGNPITFLVTTVTAMIVMSMNSPLTGACVATGYSYSTNSKLQTVYLAVGKIKMWWCTVGVGVDGAEGEKQQWLQWQ